MHFAHPNVRKRDAIQTKSKILLFLEHARLVLSHYLHASLHIWKNNLFHKKSLNLCYFFIKYANIVLLSLFTCISRLWFPPKSKHVNKYEFYCFSYIYTLLLHYENPSKPHIYIYKTMVFDSWNLPRNDNCVFSSKLEIYVFLRQTCKHRFTSIIYMHVAPPIFMQKQ